jgi:hypothetical protein
MNQAVKIAGIIEDKLVVLNVLVMMASMKKVSRNVVYVIYRAKHVQRKMKKVAPYVRQIEQVELRTHANVFWGIMMTKQQIVINAIFPV